MHAVCLFYTIIPPILVRAGRRLQGMAALAGLAVTCAAEAQEAPIHELDDVVISASPLVVNRMDAVVPVAVVDPESLKRRLEPSLGETLSGTPGVSSTYFAPGASRPIIRGLDRDRVRILDNGLGIGDVSATSEDHAVGFDAITLRKVEVVRGPATLRYGSTAIGGVVNMIDSRIPEQPIGAPATGLFDVRWGSGDDLWSVGGLIEGGQEALNFHLDGFYRQTDDIEIPGFAESAALRAEHDEDEDPVEGFVPNSDTEAYGGATGASYATDRGFIGVSVAGWASEYGVPGGHAHEHDGEEEHDEEEGDAHHEEDEGGVRIDADTLRIQMRGETYDPAPALQAIQYAGTYSTYQHDEIEGSGEVGTMFDNDAWEGRVELVHHPFWDFEGAAGFQLKYDDFSARGEEAFVPPSDTFNLGFFLFEERPIRDDLLSLRSAVRYEFQDTRTDALADRSFHTVSASAGIVCTPGETYAATLNLSYNQRAPQATELFADGPHLATRTFEIGDPELDPESSVGVDASLRRKRGWVTGGLSLFYYWFDRFISLTPTGEEEDELPVFVYRGDEAEFYGGEAEMLIHLVDTERNQLHVDLIADAVRGKNTSVDQDLPRIPPLRFLAGLEYETDRYGGRIEAVIVDEQDRTADFETATDGYQLLNVSAFTRLPVDRFDVEIFARGTNLTDEEARIHTSFLKDQAPLRGRSAMVGLRTHW